MQIEQEIKSRQNSRKKFRLLTIILIFLGTTAEIFNAQGFIPSVWITKPWEHLTLFGLALITIITGCFIWIYKCLSLEIVRGSIAIFIWIRLVMISITLPLLTAALILAIPIIFGNPQNPIATVLAIVCGAIGGVLVLLQWLVPTPVLESLIPSPSSDMTSTMNEQSWPTRITRALGSTTYRRILGQPPSINPSVIIPRTSLIEDIYSRLTSSSDTSAIVLFGIDNIGKSNLAAFIFSRANQEYGNRTTRFSAPPLWLTIENELTIADLAGTLCEAYGVSFPEFENFSQSSQTVVLTDMLSLADKSRLIVLDQLDSVLDIQSGYVKSDRPGIQDFLDALNNKQLSSRLLITSRLLPKRTHQNPSDHVQGLQVEGLNPTEGIELLKLQQLNITDTTQFSKVVERCEGHTGALISISSILRSNKSMEIPDLLNNESNAARWRIIAYNLLKSTFLQLKPEQHELLIAFAIYGKAVPLQAARALITNINLTQLLEAFDTLLALNLILPHGRGYYRLPTIVADCTFYYSLNDKGEIGLLHHLSSLHRKAADYYRDVARVTCPPLGKRMELQDINPLIEAYRQLCLADQWQDAYALMIEEDIISDLKKFKAYETLKDLFQSLFPLENWKATSVQKAKILREMQEVQKALGENQQL